MTGDEKDFGLIRARRRPHMLVGERHDFLCTVSRRHAINASYVDVLVRFPQRHTVRGFRDDLLAHASLKSAFGFAKRLPAFRRRNLFVGDGSVLLRLPFAIFPPRRRTVERALDGLIGAMRDLVSPLGAACESCNLTEGVGLYLADGIPGRYCPTCVATVVNEEKALGEALRHAAPAVGRGLAVGTLAALAFGLLFGALAAIPVVKLPHWWIYIAAPIFAIVGFLVSAVSGRGFGASAKPVVVLLKLPLALLGGIVAFTVLNAETIMALRPAEWNLVLLVSSARGAAVGGLKSTAQILAASTLAGWAVEIAWELVGTVRSATRTRIERVLPDGECEEMN